VGDGEDADAALGAAGVTDEMGTAAVVGIRDCGVYDLDQFMYPSLLISFVWRILTLE
jgi:hypothetical protein